MDKLKGVSKIGVFIGILVVFAFVNTVTYFGYSYFAEKFVLPHMSWIDTLLALILYNIVNFKIFTILNVFFPVVDDGLDD